MLAISFLGMVGTAAAVLVSALGGFYLRQSGRARRAYERRVRSIDLADIPRMARECATEYRTRLNVELVEADLDASAWALDEAMCSLGSMVALATDDQQLRGAELSGAFLGELIRRHAGAAWCRDDDIPALSLRTSDGYEMVWPFMDTINHFKAGRRGQLHAMIVALVERRRGLARGDSQ